MRIWVAVIETMWADKHLERVSVKEPKKRAWGWDLIEAHDQKAGEIIDGSEGDERGSELEKKLPHNVREINSVKRSWRNPEHEKKVTVAVLNS